MPGHVVKTEGPDPDPTPWLSVSEELFVKLKAKPYDAKKSCWVPNKATGGYDEGLIQEKDGGKVTVEILESKEVIVYEFVNRRYQGGKIILKLLTNVFID